MLCYDKTLDYLVCNLFAKYFSHKIQKRQLKKAGKPRINKYYINKRVNFMKSQFFASQLLMSNHQRTALKPRFSNTLLLLKIETKTGIDCDIYHISFFFFKLIHTPLLDCVLYMKKKRKNICSETGFLLNRDRCLVFLYPNEIVFQDTLVVITQMYFSDYICLRFTIVDNMPSMISF